MGAGRYGHGFRDRCPEHLFRRDMRWRTRVFPMLWIFAARQQSRCTRSPSLALCISDAEAGAFLGLEFS
jgi:hypothetical protein